MAQLGIHTSVSPLYNDHRQGESLDTWRLERVSSNYGQMRKRIRETVELTLIRLFLQLKQPLRDLKWPLLSIFFLGGALVTAFNGAIAIGLCGTTACCGEFDRVADDDDSPAEVSALRWLKESSITYSLDSAAPDGPASSNSSQRLRSILVESMGVRPSKRELEAVSLLPGGPERLHQSCPALKSRGEVWHR